MYRPAVVFGLYLSFAIAVGAACSNGSPALPSDDDSFTPPGQSGGSSGAGTMMGSGGSVSSGGTTGGSVASGGTTGGSVSGGGKAGSGTTTGGTTGSGGHSTGGTGTGGTGSSTGGSTATGGSSSGSAGTGTGTGGTMGAAGTTGASCDTTWMVTSDGFVRMPAKGGACWSGYAFAGGDTSSTVTFPGAAKDFSKSMGKLELTGTVGSATADNKYAGNVYFGFNVGQAAGATSSGKVTPTGTGLTITCTGCSMPVMRAQIGDGTTTWCANLTSGTAIPYTSFAQECYNTPAGTAYAKQPISSIQLSIPGAATAATFDVTLVTVVEN